jgi:hypothetical protein
VLKITLRVGDREITEGIMSWEATAENDPDRRGMLRLAKGALAAGVDYQAEVCVLDSTDIPGRPLFTGLVWSATVRDDQSVDLELRTGSQRLREQDIGGLILGTNISAQERIYSILRLAGIKPERMMLEGLAMPLPNPFEVAMPVLGCRVTSPFAVGEVTLVSNGPVAHAVDDLANTAAANTTMAGGGRLIDGYRSACCWAWTTVQSSSLDVAEELGLNNLRRAMAWISLCVRHSFSTDPGGSIRPYRRDIATFGAPRLGSVIHVRALRSQHRWLRCVHTSLSELHDLDLTMLDLPQMAAPGLLARDVWLAIISWQRASDSSDFLARSSALWQGLEHYAKAAPTQKLFSPVELDRLRAALPDWMNIEQAERFKTVVGSLNSVPLMPRLHAAMEQDGVPVSDQEFGLLKRTRELRNRIEHGELPSEADADDLRLATCLLGRLLAYRLMKPSSQAAS